VKNEREYEMKKKAAAKKGLVNLGVGRRNYRACGGKECLTTRKECGPRGLG